MHKPTRIFVREWREARGLTQQQLADAIGRDKSVLSKLERGLSGITSATLAALADAFQVSAAALYEPPPEATRPLSPGETGQVGSVSVPQPPRTTAEGLVTDGLVGNHPDLPIYASAQGGKTGMVLRYEPIDWVKRPEPLMNVRAGFGMYVVGDSMEPAYRQGDMILIHPNRPPNAGDDVLVIKRNGDDSDHEALIKRLIAESSQTVRLAQFNPPEEFSIARDDVQAVFLIVGKYNRR